MRRATRAGKSGAGAHKRRRTAQAANVSAQAELTRGAQARGAIVKTIGTLEYPFGRAPQDTIIYLANGSRS